MLSVFTANQDFAPGFTLQKKVLLCDKMYTSLNQIVIIPYLVKISIKMWVKVVNEWQALQIYLLRIKRLMGGFNVILNYYLSLLINPESSMQNWICCKCSSAAKSEVAPVVPHGHILSAPHSHMQKWVYQSSTRAELLILVMWLNLERNKNAKLLKL